MTKRLAPYASAARLAASTTSRELIPRRRPERVGARDEADHLVEGVAAGDELLAGRAGDAVGAVPRERPVSHACVSTERGVEQGLPAAAVAGAGRVVEDQQVPPVVARVAG